MNGAVLRVGGTLLALTTALAVAIITQPSRSSLFAGIYLLVLGALAVAGLAGSLRELLPKPWWRSPFEQQRELPERSESIAELERIDRLVVLGSATAFDLHYRLRPLLRQLTRERLRAAHGVDLDALPAAAQRHLGAALWELVRPDREPGNKRAAGIPLPELTAVVEELEAL